jgi:hypothetical protein
MNTITKSDFLTMVKLNHLEVITQAQLGQNTQIIKGYMEKALTAELSDVERAEGNAIISDIAGLQQWTVLRDDFSKAICYTRLEQVAWVEPVKGEFGELIKAKSGTYKPTAENKKLGRVGQIYGSKGMLEDKTSKVGPGDIKVNGKSLPEDISNEEKKDIEALREHSKKIGEKIEENKGIKGKNEGGKYTLVGFGEGKLDAGVTRMFIRVKDTEGIIYRKPLDKEDLNKFHTLSLKDKQAMVDKYFGENK